MKICFSIKEKHLSMLLVPIKIVYSNKKQTFFITYMRRALGLIIA